MSDESEKAARKAYDLRRRRAFGDLLKSEGWKYFEELLNNRLAEDGKSLLSPLPPELNARERAEHLKGTMYGIAWARDLPAVTIAGTEQAYLDDAEDNPAGED